MKTYVKPDIEVTVFALNSTVATCEITSETKYEKQTVNCIISGNEDVFNDNNTCTMGSDNAQIVILDSDGDGENETYVIWTKITSQTTGGTAPSQEKTDLLKKIVEAGGQEIDDRNSKGWHAGLATPTIISVLNSSN